MDEVEPYVEPTESVATMELPVVGSEQVKKPKAFDDLIEPPKSPEPFYDQGEIEGTPRHSSGRRSRRRRA